MKLKPLLRGSQQVVPAAIPPHSVWTGRFSGANAGGGQGGHKGRPYVPMIVLLLLFLTNCRPDPPGRLVQLSPRHSLSFLDSLAAADAISRDEDEGFFDLIQPLDMAIQMGQALPEGAEREDWLAAYREYLRADVAAFTAPEQQLLRHAFRRAFELCQPFRPDFFPDTVFLIKTLGRHYGPAVYYTREGSIVIPQEELNQRDAEELAEVMLHELFHLYSRREPQRREQLYGLLGFQRLAQPLRLPSCLQQRLLLNPDGIAGEYALPLEWPEGATAWAVPLLLSDTLAYIPGRPYFDYLDFRLYPLQPADSAWAIATAAGCRSPLPPPGRLPAFWEQIGDNTAYIIHPDEILAENFVLLARSKAGLQQRVASARGQAILEGLERLMNSPPRSLEKL